METSARPAQAVIYAEAASRHGQVFPADIRAGDSSPVQLRPQQRPELMAMGTLWQLSPLGMEVHFTSRPPELQLGDLANVAFEVAGKAVQSDAVLVSLGATHDGRHTAGLRFCTKSAAADPTQEKRQVERYRAHPLYPPTGVLNNSGSFNDSIYFRLRDLGASGFLFLTSPRNKAFLPHTTWDARLNFPTLGDVALQFCVTHAQTLEIEGRTELCVGARLCGKTTAYRRRSGQYLLQFGTDGQGQAPSPTALRAQQFAMDAFSAGFSFTYVRSQEDYQGVVALREKAYRETLADPLLAKEISWGDPLDARARILIARHRGAIVASSRLLFPEQDETLEHESFCAMPKNLPARRLLLESSRVCIDPGYRAADLLKSVFQHLIVTGAQSGRRYVLGNCHSRLLKTYQRTGSQPLGTTYVHPNDGSVHHLILLDGFETVAGRSLSFLVWCGLVAPILPLLRQYKIPQALSGRQRFSLLWRCMLAPWGGLAIRLLTRVMRHRQKK